ncbi:hypothetical protein EON81_12345 [bacterium]|nr:MAG: hypothetical protein EON81_12345 [bacterium]
MSRKSLSVRPFLTGAFMLLSVSALAAGDRLLSFEELPTGGDRLTGWNSSITRTQVAATDGQYSVRQDVSPNITGYATFEFATPLDMSDRGTLITDLYNPGNEDAKVLIYLVDANKKSVRIETVVPAGRWAHPAMVLHDRRSSSTFGLRDLPRVSPESRMITIAPWDDTGIDFKTIKQVQVVVRPTAKTQQIYFDYFRTTPLVDLRDLTTGWIDTYGQNTQINWPGKVRSDSDMAQAKADEEATFATYSGIASYDEYGGSATGAKSRATGFFRVEKQKVGWKLITPNGSRFWSLGVNSVSILDEGGKIEGKEQMFQSLPAMSGDLAPSYVRKMVNGQPSTSFSFVKANMLRKYGTNGADAWYSRAIQRMKSWGINTIGAFSDPQVLAPQAIPTTPQIGSHGALEFVVPLLPGEGMPDPYAPTFAARLSDNFWRLRPNDPMVIGYFVDNILPFSANHGRNYQVALPLAVLELNSASSPAKAALVSKLQAQYGEIGALNSAWSTNFSSWSTLAAGYRLSDRTNGNLVNGAMFDDLRGYLKDFAHKYFRTVRDTLKAADPNHMYLGSRMDYPDADILSIMGEYADITSVIVYQYDVTAGNWSILKNFDRPVMISEFGFNSYERGLPGMFVEVANEAERKTAYIDFINQCQSMSNVVGAHIFQYQDQNPHGASWMNENCNSGFLDIADSPYPEMISAARQLGNNLYPAVAGMKLNR